MTEILEKTKKTGEIVQDKTDLPTFLPVVPLRDIVIFPYMMYPILAGRESTISAINFSLEKEK